MAIATGEQATAEDVNEIGHGHINIVPHNYSSIGAGTWAYVVDGAHMTNGYWNNTTTADLDNITYKVRLAIGTYTLRILYYENDDEGIVDFDIAGAEVASFDLYNAAPTRNSVQSQAAIAVATAGIKDFRVRVHGKNGASSNHHTRIAAIALWRTA